MSNYGPSDEPYGSYSGRRGGGYPGEPGGPGRADDPSDPYHPPRDPRYEAPYEPQYEPPYQPSSYEPQYEPQYEPRYDPSYGQPAGPPAEPPSDPWSQGPDGGPDGGQWSDRTVPQVPGGPGIRPGPPPYDSGGWPDVDPEPDSGWDSSSPLSPGRPRRRGNALLFVAVGVLVLVVAGAVGYALYLLSGEEGDPTGFQLPTPEANATGAPTAGSPAAPSGEPEPDSTQNNIGLNATMAREGDCLVNHGTNAEPEMQIVPCESEEASAVYQVLAKFDLLVDGDDRAAQDASAQDTCRETAGYTHHYFEVSESASFVLCMSEQAPASDG
jgi:hypothetical protein